MNQESAPTLNTVGGGKAGAAIQVRFSLGGFFGLDDPETGIFAGQPTSKGISCPNSGDTNPVDETVIPAVSNSGLKYDEATGEYIYIWKTDRAWNNSCRELTMTLKDGTSHSLYFQFLK